MIDLAQRRPAIDLEMKKRSIQFGSLVPPHLWFFELSIVKIVPPTTIIASTVDGVTSITLKTRSLSSCGYGTIRISPFIKGTPSKTSARYLSSIRGLRKKEK